MISAKVILLVEDNESDVLFFRMALPKTGAGFQLQVATDGMEAASYLSGSGRYADRKVFPVPSLVLLDLKLPKKSGLEVLAWMKKDPSLRDVPVYVLTSSSEAGDVSAAYALGAALYFVKPMGMDKLRAFVESLSQAMADPGGRPAEHLAAFATPRPADR